MQLTHYFVKQFHSAPSHIIRSPGRVNLIGEHTDYNDGFVFPMALDRAMLLAIRPRQDSHVNLCAHNFDDQKISLDLMNLQRAEQAQWQDYVAGVARECQQLLDKPLQGFDAMIDSNIPIGAGLSSSAAFELAIAKAFAIVNDLPWDAKQMAVRCQHAENDWVGVNCGIMDQLICATGVKDHALLIDCRSLDSEAVKLPSGCTIVIMDTNTRRGLVDSAYNERRQQCEQAAQLFGVEKLRDADVEHLKQHEPTMDRACFYRAQHVITENQRVLLAKQAMLENNPVQLGILMQASHVSLDKHFGVSSTELNQMVTIADAQDGCYGARMTGAGFGGCAVALVRQDASKAFMATVAQAYYTKTGIAANLYACQAEDGTAVRSVAELTR